MCAKWGAIGGEKTKQGGEVVDCDYGLVGSTSRLSLRPQQRNPGDVIDCDWPTKVFLTLTCADFGRSDSPVRCHVWQCACLLPVFELAKHVCLSCAL